VKQCEQILAQDWGTILEKNELRDHFKQFVFQGFQENNFDEPWTTVLFEWLSGLIEDRRGHDSQPEKVITFLDIFPNLQNIIRKSLSMMTNSVKMWNHNLWNFISDIWQKCLQKWSWLNHYWKISDIMNYTKDMESLKINKKWFKVPRIRYY